MNNVILLGRLTKDPEIRYTQTGMAVANFTLAIDRPRRQEKEQGTDFIRITTFDKTAENINKYYI